MQRMATRRSVSLSLLVMAGLLPFAASADLTLIAAGQPRAAIVTADKPSDKVKTAAADLQAYLQKITGAKLPLATDADPPQGALILVGKSKLTDALGITIPAGLTEGRRDEGFVIATRGNRLLLAGNDVDPYHGTEYAVYEFLNRLGVRWFMPGEYGEVVPHQTTLTVPEMRVTEKPDFAMRNWWLHALPELAEQEKRWKLRNKMNPDEAFAIPGDSSVRNVLPPPERVKSEPELFALNEDGTRNPHYPNLTNPKTVQFAADVIKKHFREHPEANSYGFAPDDGLPRDYNPETLKVSRGFVDLLGRPGVPAEMSTTEEWLLFVNQVTAEVRREFPNAYIATNGYANRNLPPEGVRLDDHLIIMFAAIWSCTLHAYDDPHCWQKVRQGDMLRRWCELCKNVWIYGYNYEMLVSGLAPLPETRKLSRDFPLMKRWGVMGFWDENRNVWAEAGIPSRYMRARLEWHADADPDALLRDFYEKWYGPAAEPASAFNEFLENAIEASPIHGHEDRVLPWLYTPELMATLDRQLVRAERAVKSQKETDPARVHVRADRLIFEHLRGYVDVASAEAAGDWSGAARACGRMMDLRKQLHAISPFYIWFDETRYHSGIWYWGILDRQKYYESLADMTGGKTGDLIAVLPATASFRTDPHGDGLAQRWYATDSAQGWSSVNATMPFYLQGFQDAQGHPYIGDVWYRFGVDVAASAKGKRAMLYLPAVETEAWYWVNGEYVGHRGYQEAYTRPLQLEGDVTAALRPGGKNTITLRVNTSLNPAQTAGGLVSRGFLYAPR